MLTAERARFLFNYYPESGRLTRRINGHGYKEGEEVGTRHGDDKLCYLRCTVEGESWLVHRLIWLHQTGEMPKGKQIDHIDHDGMNNAWENLRLVQPNEQAQNRGVRSTNKLGVSGVHWDKGSKKWRAIIGSDGGKVILGHFASVNEAVEVRRAAEAAHGYHPNHGDDGEIDWGYVALMEATRPPGWGVKRQCPIARTPKRRRARGKVEPKPAGRKKGTNNTSGVPGVHFVASRNLWQARITVEKRRKSLGYYKTKDEAVEARRKAESEIHQA